MKFPFRRLILGTCAFGSVAISASAMTAPSAEEMAQTNQWAQQVFFSTTPASSTSSPAATTPQPGMRVLRSDYVPPQINQSARKTPIHIGTKNFAHGIGVNSFSEIEVTLPPGATHFDAQVGVDNNWDTAGTKGSVEFIVEVDGKQLFKSPVVRCGSEALPISLDLNGAKTLTLKVTDGGDGCSWDQADWAEATLTQTTGGKILLNDLPIQTLSLAGRSESDLPFSFIYSGKSSYDLLKTWPRTVTEDPSSNPGVKHSHITWKDPASGLEVRCELTQFADSSATDWIVWLTNTGQTDTPVIEKLLALDLVAPGVKPMLTYSHGSAAGSEDFLPKTQAITDESLTLAAQGGRSSCPTLPFFNIHDDGTNNGLMLGLGWSGQWESAFQMAAVSPGTKELYLTSGQQGVELKLKPGETIRTPRILMLRYAGRDPQRGHNLLRQTLLAHYVPRLEGKIALPPVAAMTWFTYNNGSGVTETNQLQALATMAPLGIEDFWLDAGWYGNGDWSNSVGSWETRKDVFPRGLKPISDAAHAAGMKFILWLEPERVQKNTTIALEHPEFVHGGANGGLFKLDDPVARKWMTELLSDHIRDDGIDVLRIDYNLDPLNYWRGADDPDREGMTENLYMQGLYTMWDELRARYPHMLIDDCASGGRRIDLETISRSIPLWRSDRPCDGKAAPVFDQGETAGLSLWIPLHTEGQWGFDPYTSRSVATAGAIICADLRDPKKYPPEEVKRALAEIKELRELWLGDYYPLTDIGIDESHWMAWQFDRPDLGKGFAMVFRRPKVSETSFTAQLRGLNPDATYEVRLVDENKTLKMSGKELAAFKIDLPQPSSSALVTYRKIP